MPRAGLRFDAKLFSFGVATISISAGVARLTPNHPLPSTVLFVVGLAILSGGLLQVYRRPVVIHDRWDHLRICEAMRRAPTDSTIRIIQTWFPEEDFVGSLRSLLAEHDKDFELKILLLDPGPSPHEPSNLLISRVLLRGLSPAVAAEKIRCTASDLEAMKRAVDARWQKRPGRGSHLRAVDLAIRFYRFMPFGPIYQIGDSVMFVGLFINHGTSAEGPMLEVRNAPGNRLWHLFMNSLDVGWESSIPHRSPVDPFLGDDSPEVGANN